MGYFAALVPNTAIAKEAGRAYWSQGWRYTRDFVGRTSSGYRSPVLPPGRSALRARRAARAARRCRAVLAPMLSAVAHWLYVTRVGGDFMHGRLFLPSLLGFLLPVATVVIPFGPRRWRGLVLRASASGPSCARFGCACPMWARVRSGLGALRTSGGSTPTT